MPRRRRGFLDHACYHITHRCHKREFLLKFAMNRDLYLDLLRETVARYKIDVLDYVVTSNHVHLLIWSRRGSEVPLAMQYLPGQVRAVIQQEQRARGGLLERQVSQHAYRVRKASWAVPVLYWHEHGQGRGRRTSFRMEAFRIQGVDRQKEKISDHQRRAAYEMPDDGRRR